MKNTFIKFIFSLAIINLNIFFSYQVQAVKSKIEMEDNINNPSHKKTVKTNFKELTNTEARAFLQKVTEQGIKQKDMAMALEVGAPRISEFLHNKASKKDVDTIVSQLNAYLNKNAEFIGVNVDAVILKKRNIQSKIKDDPEDKKPEKVVKTKFKALDSAKAKTFLQKVKEQGKKQKDMAIALEVGAPRISEFLHNKANKEHTNLIVNKLNAHLEKKGEFLGVKLREEDKAIKSSTAPTKNPENLSEKVNAKPSKKAETDDRKNESKKKEEKLKKQKKQKVKYATTTLWDDSSEEPSLSTTEIYEQIEDKRRKGELGEFYSGDEDAWRVGVTKGYGEPVGEPWYNNI